MDDDQKNITAHKKADQIWVNILLAGMFVGFLFYFIQDYMATTRLSSLFMVIETAVIVVMFAIRAYPQRLSYAPYDWTIALAGTWLPMLLRPSGALEDNEILLGIQVFGIALSTLGILSLNRSFGIVPAARGVKTGGLYRFVRHPIYLGYVFSFTAITLQNFGVYNLVILIGILGADVLRILAEEKFLAKDEAYRTYMSRVKWRVIPLIW
jgi:uncharacterized membrane protein (UPF0136 family)